MNEQKPAYGEAAGDVVQGEPVSPDDERWLVELLNQRPDGRIRLRPDYEQDVSGHLASEDATLVRVVIESDGEDTAGHAMSIRLPSAEEANAFRRRLLLTGVLVGTVVLGGAGAALAVSQADATPSQQAAGQHEDISYHDADPNNATV